MGVMGNVTYILDIRLDDLVFVAPRGHFRAVVIMRTDTSTLCLIACLEGPPHLPVTLVQQGLTQDALRQLRQLPEYRNGRKEIAIAAQDGPILRQSA
jgi:hypothetical protein